MNFITGNMLREASAFLSSDRSSEEAAKGYVTYSCVALHYAVSFAAAEAYERFLRQEDWLHKYGAGTVLDVCFDPIEEQQAIRFMLLHFIAEAIDGGSISIPILGA